MNQNEWSHHDLLQMFLKIHSGYLKMDPQHIFQRFLPVRYFFGLHLGLLWQTLGRFGCHLDHFEETFWTSESIFCLHRRNLGKTMNSLENRSSGAFWGSLDREIFAYFGQKIDPRGATRGRRGQRESKKTEKRAKQRPKRQSWRPKGALEGLWRGFGQRKRVWAT